MKGRPNLPNVRPRKHGVIRDSQYETSTIALGAVHDVRVKESETVEDVRKNVEGNEEEKGVGASLMADLPLSCKAWKGLDPRHGSPVG